MEFNTGEKVKRSLAVAALLSASVFGQVQFGVPIADSGVTVMLTRRPAMLGKLGVPLTSQSDQIQVWFLSKIDPRMIVQASVCYDPIDGDQDCRTVLTTAAYAGILVDVPAMARITSFDLELFAPKTRVSLGNRESSGRSH
jgi:hypothetical protein